ncbi:MAG: PD-(D/E)XK nuclease family protein [Flavobacteriaceae bacterium]|nr:PD-(D/E)XK nuclease family protein [Flavobacteriaceae bacterium]
MNIIELKDFFEKEKIPHIPKSKLTFLKISKQPHYENVMSNIYAFFFNSEQEHGFKDLLLNSLHQCIIENEEWKDFPFYNDYTVKTEYTTKKRGRIDLLLKNESSAIIIENKMYHHLDNGLNDYWTSGTEDLETSDESIGVILSLKKIEPGNKNFINITHQQLMKKIRQNFGAYLLDAKPKYIVYFQDFQQNIDNLSKKNMKQEHLDFYIENSDKIKAILELNKKYKDAVHEQFVALKEGKLFSEHFEYANKYPSKKSQYYKLVSVFQLRRKSNLRIRIKFSYRQLINKETDFLFKVRIDTKQKLENSVFNRLIDDLSGQIHFEGNNKSDTTFITKIYYPTKEERKNLTNYILDKLKEDDLINIAVKIGNHLNA